ncbi:MAG: hypothetical protein U5R31_04985 [Acidimicrobiia bacterium]|nr:hypothetical protein [Acidimicrobiia bacterium]
MAGFHETLHDDRLTWENRSGEPDAGYSNMAGPDISYVDGVWYAHEPDGTYRPVYEGRYLDFTEVDSFESEALQYEVTDGTELFGMPLGELGPPPRRRDRRAGRQRRQSRRPRRLRPVRRRLRLRRARAGRRRRGGGRGGGGRRRRRVRRRHGRTRGRSTHDRRRRRRVTGPRAATPTRRPRRRRRHPRKRHARRGRPGLRVGPRTGPLRPCPGGACRRSRGEGRAPACRAIPRRDRRPAHANRRVRRAGRRLP